MTKQEYMSLYNYENEKELFRDGYIEINSYSFFPNEISSFGNTNTKTYAIEPSRNEDFSMPTINLIPTANIPRLKINFDIMSLEVWRRMKLATSPNEFLVKYYDWEYDKVVSRLMYFATQDDIDIFEQFGAKQEYYIRTKKTIDIVATMNILKKLTVTYYYNYNDIVKTHIQEVLPNDLFYTYNGFEFIAPNNKLIGWNTRPNGDGTAYGLGMALTIIDNLELYAQWQESAERTLSFDYQGAIRQPLDNSESEDKNWLINKSVTLNSAVGELPNPKYKLTKNDKLEDACTLLGWWNIPYDWKANGNNHNAWLEEQNKIYNDYPNVSNPIKQYTSSTIYNIDGNTTIYAHWKPNTWTITFNSNGGTNFENLNTWYGASIDKNKYLPTKDGYVFQGWYVDSKYNTKFSWIMPNQNITLYAKWEEV